MKPINNSWRSAGSGQSGAIVARRRRSQRRRRRLASGLPVACASHAETGTCGRINCDGHELADWTWQVADGPSRMRGTSWQMAGSDGRNGDKKTQWPGSREATAPARGSAAAKQSRSPSGGRRSPRARTAANLAMMGNLYATRGQKRAICNIW